MLPSHKVYRRDDRGIVGVESFGLQGLAFVVIHTSVGRASRSCGSGAITAPVHSARLFTLAALKVVLVSTTFSL